MWLSTEPLVIPKIVSHSQSRRWRFVVAAILLILFWVPPLKAATPLIVGRPFAFPPMESVEGTTFDLDQFKSRWLLIFASSRDSADQSKRWGKAIANRYKKRIAGWNKDQGQRVLVVAALDTSSGVLDHLPLWATKFLVRNLSDGDERVAVLIDRAGVIRNQVQPPLPSDAVLILLGPDAKLETYVVGDYSPESAAKLFAAIDSALDGAK